MTVLRAELAAAMAEQGALGAALAEQFAVLQLHAGLFATGEDGATLARARVAVAGLAVTALQARSAVLAERAGRLRALLDALGRQP